ncbi:hypothetical protein SEA_ALEEMILY_58 [Gordonia phage Aleemily]|uniref:Uncharacterized protein n=1 Tax=Gordonia phage Aleemily TaxID=2965181 RepID=A0A9E7TVG4_9CAUD|nr:hypothetical protein SEA_ALEEMILY_58 [Gordonia phage Aleemily]
MDEPSYAPGGLVSPDWTRPWIGIAVTECIYSMPLGVCWRQDPEHLAANHQAPTRVAE